MSLSENVQLVPTTLQTSPTMKKSSVCRCLFGRPDRETESNIRAELRKETDEDLGVARLNYGFDFELDKPLCNGPYEWTEVAAEDIPSFYRETKRISRSKSKTGREPSARLRRNIFAKSEDSPMLSFSSERLRGDTECKSSPGLGDSSPSRTTLNDVETSNADPISRDITTPCVKKLNKLDVSEKSNLNRLNSVSSASTCSTGSNSMNVGLPETGKAKVQSSIVDFLKIRKRKASNSISRSAKSLRRL